MRASFSVLSSMARKLRYVPEPRTLVFITCRTVQGRFLLRPGPALNDIVLGTLGRCQRNHDLTLCAVTTPLSRFLPLPVRGDPRPTASSPRASPPNLAPPPPPPPLPAP